MSSSSSRFPPLCLVTGYQCHLCNNHTSSTFADHQRHLASPSHVTQETQLRAALRRHEFWFQGTPSDWVVEDYWKETGLMPEDDFARFRDWRIDAMSRHDTAFRTMFPHVLVGWSPPMHPDREQWIAAWVEQVVDNNRVDPVWSLELRSQMLEQPVDYWLDRHAATEHDTALLASVVLFRLKGDRYTYVDERWHDDLDPDRSAQQVENELQQFVRTMMAQPEDPKFARRVLFVARQLFC